MDPNRFPTAKPTHPFAGRPLQWPEVVMCRFPSRTGRRIERVLKLDETRASFLRLSVERELREREAEIERREREAERAARVAVVETLIAPSRSSSDRFGFG